jgi:nucleotide-binding universal stress UspA family protein
MRGFRKVVIGVDRGQGGRDAIALAGVLAPGSECLPTTVKGSAATVGKQLCALAAKERADLLVVGSSQRGALDRAVAGDVARAALRGAPCPVAVAPPGFGARPVKVVGVAFDESPESEAALALAADLARDRGAQLRVVGAAGFGWPADGEGWEIPELVAAVREAHQKVIDRAVAELDVPADAEAVVGFPGPVVGRLAGEADVLFCGSRGRGALGRMILGSTSDQLVHLDRVPVVVVPRSALPSSEG